MHLQCLMRSAACCRCDSPQLCTAGHVMCIAPCGNRVLHNAFGQRKKHMTYIVLHLARQ